MQLTQEAQSVLIAVIAHQPCQRRTVSAATGLGLNATYNLLTYLVIKGHLQRKPAPFNPRNYLYEQAVGVKKP